MPLPLRYNLRHLQVRWRSNLATVLSIALVVAVFVMVMALARGLSATYFSSGQNGNILVLRKGAMAESSSQISSEEIARAKSLPGIARNPHGDSLTSAEMIILITMNRRGGGHAHVQVRGLGPVGRELRPEIHLVAGRAFEPGQRECIVSQKVARRFRDCGLGETFRSGKNTWTVVGIFEAGQTAYDSEVWLDADEARDAFNRTFYCSILLRPENEAASKRLISTIDSDKSVRLRAVTEREYYDDQTKTAAPIRWFGLGLAGVMSIGAVFFAMNTMYAAVGRRTREIGTLRVLGFNPTSIYLAFLLESLLLAAGGGVLGCILALPLHGVATGTFNWSTFAEVAFEFRLSIMILLAGIGFALLIGLAGGILPARMAARKPLLDALRAS